MDLKAEFVSQLPPDDRYELAWLKGEILTMASGYKARVFQLQRGWPIFERF